MGEIVVKHGKGNGVWYLFIYIWALGYAITRDSDMISRLERENETLTENLEFYKGINEELKNKLDITNTSQHTEN